MYMKRLGLYWWYESSRHLRVIFKILFRGNITIIYIPSYSINVCLISNLLVCLYLYVQRNTCPYKLLVIHARSPSFRKLTSADRNFHWNLEHSKFVLWHFRKRMLKETTIMQWKDVSYISYSYKTWFDNFSLGNKAERKGRLGNPISIMERELRLKQRKERLHRMYAL